MVNAFDLSCTKCGNPDSLDIEALVWVRLTRDGTDADQSHDGSHVWEPDSIYQCCACGHSGYVSELEGYEP